MTTQTEYIGPDDMLFYNNKDGEINCGGFSVNSIMMKNGISPIMTLNSNYHAGGGENKVSDLFNNLVIPSWSLSYGYKGGAIFCDRHKEYEHDDVVDDDLHEKLLELVKANPNEIKKTNKMRTKKKCVFKQKGTKKYKK
jgi:hypothetical protein